MADSEKIAHKIIVNNLKILIIHIMEKQGNFSREPLHHLLMNPRK